MVLDLDMLLKEGGTHDNILMSRELKYTQPNI